jgi:hypothetical protein
MYLKSFIVAELLPVLLFVLGHVIGMLPEPVGGPLQGIIYKTHNVSGAFAEVI